MTTTKPKPAIEPGGARVAVFDATNANRKRAAEVCRALGCEVFDHGDVDTVVGKVTGREADLVLVGLPAGQKILDAARALGDPRPVLVVTLPGPPETAHARCEQSGADLFVIRPLDADALAAVVRAADMLQRERARIAAMEKTERGLRERLAAAGEPDSATGFQHFSYFQKYLLTELKRAKRYGYSIALCLVAVDPREGEKDPPELSSRLRSRIAASIKACIRDIDLVVDYADDRILVLLPYTEIDGAERVGRRIAQAVAEYGKVEEGARKATATVSVGISALREGKPVSFAKLVRDAGAAIKAAQLQGGSRVVVRK